MENHENGHFQSSTFSKLGSEKSSDMENASKNNNFNTSGSVNACSKLATETLEQDINYVQS